MTGNTSVYCIFPRSCNCDSEYYTCEVAFWCRRGQVLTSRKESIALLQHTVFHSSRLQSKKQLSIKSSAYQTSKPRSPVHQSTFISSDSSTPQHQLTSNIPSHPKASHLYSPQPITKPSPSLSHSSRPTKPIAPTLSILLRPRPNHRHPLPLHRPPQIRHHRFCFRPRALPFPTPPLLLLLLSPLRIRPHALKDLRIDVIHVSKPQLLQSVRRRGVTK